jgi:hypothetical protein
VTYNDANGCEGGDIARVVSQGEVEDDFHEEKNNEVIDEHERNERYKTSMEDTQSSDGSGR